MTMTRKDTISNYPNLTLSEIRALIEQKNEHIEISSKITPYDNDESWKERCKDAWFNAEKSKDPKLSLLHDKLLSIGGCEAIIPSFEEDLDNILEYGVLWDNITQRFMTGRPSACHANSSELWYNNRSSSQEYNFAVVLCTGYALTSDGFWRQHSWLIHCKPRANNLIETTVPRIAYFGFGMTYEMSEEFADENY